MTTAGLVPLPTILVENKCRARKEGEMGKMEGEGLTMGCTGVLDK